MKRIAILSVTLFLAPQIINAHIITFFVKRYPSWVPQGMIQKQAIKLDKPGKASSTLELHQHKMPGHLGVFAIYAGYLNLSDRTGQITFPLKHQAPFVDLIITQRLVPVTMDNRIIHHWEIPPHEPAAVFHIHQHEDKETKLSYWDVSQKKSPEDGVVPLRSIIVFAHPESVFVPTGITLAKKSPNMLLPSMYIKQEFASGSNAAHALTVRKFFETPQLLYQMIPYGYAQQWFAVN